MARCDGQRKGGLNHINWDCVTQCGCTPREVSFPLSFVCQQERHNCRPQVFTFQILTLRNTMTRPDASKANPVQIRRSGSDGVLVALGRSRAILLIYVIFASTKAHTFVQFSSGRFLLARGGCRSTRGEHLCWQFTMKVLIGMCHITVALYCEENSSRFPTLPLPRFVLYSQHFANESVMLAPKAVNVPGAQSGRIFQVCFAEAPSIRGEAVSWQNGRRPDKAKHDVVRLALHFANSS